MPREPRHVLAPLAKRRQMQHAVLETPDDRVSKIAAPYGFRRIVIRRENETGSRLGVESLEDPFLDRGRDAIDSGHEESAGPRSRERLDESFAVGRFDERVGAARRESVKKPRRGFLLGAFLPRDQHGAFRSEALDRGHRFDPAARTPGQGDRGLDAGEPQSSFLPAQVLLPAAPEALQEDGDAGGGHRPPEKVVGAVFHRRDRVLETAGGGESPERAIRLAPAEDGVQALGFRAGQIEGDDDDVRQEFRKMPAGLECRPDAPDLSSGGGDGAAQGIA